MSRGPAASPGIAEVSGGCVRLTWLISIPFEGSTVEIREEFRTLRQQRAGTFPCYPRSRFDDTTTASVAGKDCMSSKEAHHDTQDSRAASRALERRRAGAGGL